MSGAGLGQRQRGSSAGLGRHQAPLCPRPTQVCPGTGDSLPASPSGVGSGYLQCRRRRAVKTPLQQPGNLAGREKEVQGEHGPAAGVTGAATYLPQGPPHQANHHRHLARVLYWRPNDNTEAPQTRPGATNGGAGRP